MNENQLVKQNDIIYLINEEEKTASAIMCQSSNSKR